MAPAAEDVWIPTACDMCFNACTVRVHRVDGVAVKVEGIPEAGPNYGSICAKGQAALLNVYSPFRVRAPMVRTNPEKGIGVDPGWREVSWEAALDLLVSKLRSAREKDASPEWKTTIPSSWRRAPDLRGCRPPSRAGS
jgi:molybdopterin-containing oxidoreductase family molybdopterin binding subunit